MNALSTLSFEPFKKDYQQYEYYQMMTFIQSVFSLFPAFLILVDLGILSSASRGANTNIQQEIENHSRSTIQSSSLSLFKGLL